MSSVDRFKTFLEKDSKGHFRATDKGAGMTQKGVDAFRRANPGSKLQTAVTTKPSKLKKGSKAANRRKSFCARSAGQMKKFPAAAISNRSGDITHFQFENLEARSPTIGDFLSISPKRVREKHT